MDHSAKQLIAVEKWADRLRVAGAGKSAGATAKHENQRWASRKTADLPGLICSASLQRQVKCRMHDSSSSGARLRLQSEADKLSVDDIPDTFSLFLMNSSGYSEVQCVVIRRFGDCLGVKYTSAFRTVVKDRSLAKAPAGKRR